MCCFLIFLDVCFRGFNAGADKLDVGPLLGGSEDGPFRERGSVLLYVPLGYCESMIIGIRGSCVDMVRHRKGKNVVELLEVSHVPH